MPRGVKMRHGGCSFGLCRGLRGFHCAPFANPLGHDVKQVQGGLVVCHLEWVDNGLGHSTVCPDLLGQMGIGLNRLGSEAKWWNI